jgi:hypothetical protein
LRTARARFDAFLDAVAIEFAGELTAESFAVYRQVFGQRLLENRSPEKRGLCPTDIISL